MNKYIYIKRVNITLLTLLKRQKIDLTLFNLYFQSKLLYGAVYWLRQKIE